MKVKLYNPKTGEYVSNKGLTKIRYYALLFDGEFQASLYQRKNGLANFERIAYWL